MVVSEVIMNDTSETRSAVSQITWQDIAVAACQSPSARVVCLSCGQTSVGAEWNLVNLKLRQIVIDMRCSTCGAGESLRLRLPDGAAGFFPLERFPLVAKAMQEELASIGESVRKH